MLYEQIIARESPKFPISIILFYGLILTITQVHPLIDRVGELIGPKRVWDKFNDGPGLAMSRCFGDKNAMKLGIIAIPS